VKRNYNKGDRMIAAKRALSLDKKKKAAFITWPKLCELENPTLPIFPSPKPKIPSSFACCY